MGPFRRCVNVHGVVCARCILEMGWCHGGVFPG